MDALARPTPRARTTTVFALSERCGNNTPGDWGERPAAFAGGFYHDIGKINKPDYFVENQVAGTGNRDGGADLIIPGPRERRRGDGREYGVRPSATSSPNITGRRWSSISITPRARPAGRANPSFDSDYRYPETAREIAVVMLCDGVEGAVRAMSEPTPGRIESVVKELIRKRLIDGQLDECDLTFREFWSKSLCALYHARIAYPESDEAEAREKSSTGEKSRTGPAAKVSV